MSDYEIPSKPGIYTLIIELTQNCTIKIGQLGVWDFPKGLYTYTGSALGLKSGLNLKRRVGRHLSSEKKKHWHIDYLLNSRFSKIIAIIYSETHIRIECTLSKNLEKLKYATNIVTDFGSSDCHSYCRSHLHHFSKINSERLIIIVYEIHKKFCKSTCLINKALQSTE